MKEFSIRQELYPCEQAQGSLPSAINPLSLQDTVAAITDLDR